MYIYICIYIDIYIYSYTHIYTHIYTYTHVYCVCCLKMHLHACKNKYANRTSYISLKN